MSSILLGGIHLTERQVCDQFVQELVDAYSQTSNSVTLSLSLIIYVTVLLDPSSTFIESLQNEIFVAKI